MAIVRTTHARTTKEEFEYAYSKFQDELSERKPTPRELVELNRLRKACESSTYDKTRYKPKPKQERKSLPDREILENEVYFIRLSGYSKPFQGIVKLKIARMASGSNRMVYRYSVQIGEKTVSLTSRDFLARKGQ